MFSGFCSLCLSVYSICVEFFVLILIFIVYWFKIVMVLFMGVYVYDLRVNFVVSNTSFRFKRETSKSLFVIFSVCLYSVLWRIFLYVICDLKLFDFGIKLKVVFFLIFFVDFRSSVFFASVFAFVRATSYRSMFFLFCILVCVKSLYVFLFENGVIDFFFWFVFVFCSNCIVFYSARTYVFSASFDSSSGTTRSVGSVFDEFCIVYVVNMCVFGGDCDCDDVIVVVVCLFVWVCVCVVLGVLNVFVLCLIVICICNDLCVCWRCDEWCGVRCVFCVCVSDCVIVCVVMVIFMCVCDVMNFCCVMVYVCMLRNVDWYCFFGGGMKTSRTKTARVWWDDVKVCKIVSEWIEIDWLKCCVKDVVMNCCMD